MREINKVIIHCSATPADRDIGVDEIRDWHVNGNGWSDIGYHYVIARDGTLQNGRPQEIEGAHCKGHNSGSLGVCLVGGTDKDLKPELNFTVAQYRTLQDLVEDSHWYELTIHGHYEFSDKACPVLDVEAFIKDGTIKERKR